ncbi:MAG: hypothetical protein ACRCZ0_00740 [Cetobacterium sp.]
MKTESYNEILKLLSNEDSCLSETDALNSIITHLTGEEWSAPPVESVNMLAKILKEQGVGGENFSVAILLNEALGSTSIETIGGVK